MHTAYFRRALTLAVLPALFLTPCITRGDIAPLVPMQASAATLDQALVQAQTPKEDAFLAVDAAKVRLPKDGTAPQEGSPIPEVADAYGQITQAFETVTAVAPPTMTLLNSDPGTPNPYDGMPPKDALKILLGSLDGGEWGLLTGQAGLGYADLTDDSQRGLFLALFPNGTLTVRPATGQQDAGNDIHLTGDDLRQAKLHLGQRVGFRMPLVDGGRMDLDAAPDPPGGPPQYEAVMQPPTGPNDTLYGAKVRAVVPNAPKDSDLDYEGDALKQTVPLGGVRTVGDLVARVGRAVKLELYADRRYEGRTVTLLGPPSARASDLLRAVALCVCGTYRKVGPAYVLTNDRLGLGTRKMILERFAQEAEIARHAALDEAGDRLFTLRGGVDNLPMLDDAVAFNDAEKADSAKNAWLPGQGISVDLPLSHLTLAQQDVIRGMVQQWNDGLPATPPPGVTVTRATLGGPIHLESLPVLRLESPAVPGPVSLSHAFAQLSSGGFVVDGTGGKEDFFQPSAKIMDEYESKQMDRFQPKGALPASSPLPPSKLASLIAPLKRRAVLARPRNAQEVDALVASMRRIGLNQLWLNVFSDGQTHLDKSSDGTPDILTEALAKTRGTGIVVIPTLDLLNWGTDALEAARDLTILGETSAQEQARRQHYTRTFTKSLRVLTDPPPPSVFACPASPTVEQTLTGLVKRLAATPGVAALAVRETEGNGYTSDEDAPVGPGELGYTLPLRLALLRRMHVDSMDLKTTVDLVHLSVDTSVPEFDDPAALGDTAKQWNVLRAQANLALMRRLLLAAQGSAGRRLGLLVQERGRLSQGDWYGLWDDPRAPLPVLTMEAFHFGIGGADFLALAHSQCRVDVSTLRVWAGEPLGNIASSLQRLPRGWDGVVMDFSQEPGIEQIAALAGDTATAPPGPTGIR